MVSFILSSMGYDGQGFNSAPKANAKSLSALLERIQNLKAQIRMPKYSNWKAGLNRQLHELEGEYRSKGGTNH